MPPTNSTWPRPGQPPSLEVLLDDQSRRWQEGDRFLVEAYLQSYPDLAGGAPGVLELIEHEVALRQARGETPRFEEYVRRFPDLAVPLRDRLEEYLAQGPDAPPPYVVNEDRLLAAVAGIDADPVAAPVRPQIESAAALVTAIGQAHVLTPAQLAELTQQLQPRCSDARSLARELLQRGWLTPYQVNQLFQGKGGQLVLGQYVVLERLGEGGMGQVFKARHRLLDRIVAVKRMHPEQLADGNAVRRFHREVRAAAQLSHPNVVHAFDADQVGATHLLVMEYVEGSDLAAMVKKNGPLPVALACEYIRQAALGLQHAHEHGLVHRDIKPSNLLLSVVRGASSVAQTSGPMDDGPRATDHGQIKLLDLGLARLKEPGSEGDSSATLTNSATIMGTPDYIAPEQIRQSHRVDIRADLYSLGCTLYFLLTGRPPFAGGSIGEKLLKHQMDEPEPVEKLRPGVPLGVSRVLRKLLAKRPEERYHTPAELAAVLAEGLHGRWPEARRDGGEAVPAAIPLGRGPAPGDRPSAPGSGLSSLMDPPTQPRLDAPWRRRLAAGKRRWRLLNGGGVLLLGLLGLVLFLLLRNGPHPRRVPTPRVEPVRSPLDQLDAGLIPAEERFTGQPKELVAILGTGQMRHWGMGRSVAFSPDGKTLASGGSDDCVRLWDVATLRQREEFRPGSGVGQVAFAPDGKRLAVTCTGNIELWDLSGAGPRKQATLPGAGPAGAVAFSAGGTMLAGSFQGENSVRLWALTGGKPELKALLQGHTAKVRAIAFAPNGKILASGSYDNTLRLWDLSGDEPREIATAQKHTTLIVAVAFTPDGKTLASIEHLGDHKIRLWDVTAGVLKERAALPGYVNISLAISGDSKALAVGNAGGELRLWDLTAAGRKGPTATIATGTGYARGLAFGPDGKTLAAIGDSGTVRLWDLSGEKPQERTQFAGHSYPVTGVAFAPGDTLLASFGGLDGKVRLWDLTGQTPRERAALNGAGGSVASIAFSPDGERLVCGSASRNVRQWGLLSGPVPEQWGDLVGHTSYAPLVACARKTLASGSSDGTIRLWNLAGRSATEQAVLNAHGNVRSLAFSPDGATLAEGGYVSATLHYLCLWALTEAGWRERTLLKPPGVSFFPLAFSPSPPDGKTLAACSTSAVCLWDLGGDQQPEQRATLEHPVGRRPTGLAYAPNGRALAVSDEGGHVTLWDTREGRKLRDWRLPGAVNGVAHAADGRHLATANSNGTIYILRLP